MKIKNIFTTGISLVVYCLFVAVSCTDLDPTVYNKIVTDNFYKNREETMSVVLRPYTHSRAVFGQTSRENYWKLNELSADQLAWPQKGRHGYDDAKWIQLHYHTWNYSHNTIKDCWNLTFMGLGFCNSGIENLSGKTVDELGITEEERAAFIAELKANRAYYYLKALDLWGNVPISTTVQPSFPETKSHKEVFEFVESEILEVIDDLPLLSAKGLNIGRFTKAAGYAMLVELYLNAEKWYGQARWDDCIKYCDLLMQGKGGAQKDVMKLDKDILTTYSNTNTQDAYEHILVLSYDYQDTNDRCGWGGDFYHFNQKYIYGGTSNGNDGVVVIPSAYDKFADNDLRKKEWMLIGPQYYYDDPTKPVEGTDEYKGKPLVFVKEIQRFSEGKTESSMTTGEENSGARFNKYRPGAEKDANYWSNDWVLYRLTEIYFAKAEALIRKNGGKATAEAVQLINDCRKRAFSDADWETEKYTTATLTMDELLEERGREFIFEGKRRADLIRFGKFLTKSWWDHKPTTSEHLEWYPIPRTQRELNPNLVQNPGYVEN